MNALLAVTALMPRARNSGMSWEEVSTPERMAGGRDSPGAFESKALLA